MRNQHKTSDFQCHHGHLPCYSSPTTEDTDTGLASVRTDWGYSSPLGQPRQAEQTNGVYSEEKKVQCQSVDKSSEQTTPARNVKY